LASTPAGAIDAWIEAQLRPETIDDADVERAIRRLSSLEEPAGELYEYKKPVLLHDLVTATLLRAIHSRRQLHAVMVEFWTDHFNIDMWRGTAHSSKPLTTATSCVAMPWGASPSSYGPLL